MESRRDSLLSRIINIEKPYFFVPVVALISFLLFWIGLMFFYVTPLSQIYWYAFSVLISLLFAFSVYADPSFRSWKVYLGSIIFFYSMIIFIGAMPGYYMARMLPQAVSQANQTIVSIRTQYRSVFSMAGAIFSNNVRIDAVSFVPFVGPFVLAMAIVNTSSVVWGLTFTEMFSNNPYWFVGPLAVIIAPDTFTEFSSYVLSLIGGLYLFRALSSMSLPDERNRSLVRAFTFLALSLALLYLSALLEAYLIIRFGL